MERESFEDGEVAALLNGGFISIKVDREERPDIDNVYMSVCQAYTGQGGWPLTIVMTPSQQPFFAATYLPKRTAGPHRGLMELLPALSGLWRNNRRQLEEQGEATARFLREQESDTPPKNSPSERLIHSAAQQLKRSFDAGYGGFSSAPKFPMPHTLLLLLLHSRQTGDETALAMAEQTLLHMVRGGLFDHIGGGFSRYSTDRRYLVPHFEKMLYDNALLLIAYLEAYEMTQKPIYRYVAERTFAYVLDELRGDLGGFYCGQDADSEGVEGKYYLFTPQQVREALPQQGEAVCTFLGIQPGGNFEGASIPNLLHHQDTPVPDAIMQQSLSQLLAYRKMRVKPATDDKLLTAWNGLMISALARGYRALGDKSYLTAAQNAVQCVETYLTQPGGDLFVRYRDGRADHDGQLADYAFYGHSLLELYAVTADVRLLGRAAFLARRMLEHFACEQGGLYVYAAAAEQLIVRPRETYDGALPSGNSAAALLLVRLSRLTGDVYFMEQAQRQLEFLSAHAARSPVGHCYGLLAVAEYILPGAELVIVSKEECDWAQELRELIPQPSYTAVLVKTPSTGAALGELAPFTQAYPIPEQGVAYYVCGGGACRPPVFEKRACRALLAGGETAHNEPLQ